MLLRATLTATAIGRIYFARRTVPIGFVLKRLRVWSPNTDFVTVDAVKEARNAPGEWSMQVRAQGAHNIDMELNWTFESSDAYVTSVYADTVGDVFTEELEVEEIRY